jgi:hypothetical protein
MSITTDVTGLVPQAQPIVAAAAEVYLRHLEPWFVGLIAHGSAVKGGFIPNCSDIDLQLYLYDAALSEDGQLPLDLLLPLHGDLARVDLGVFRYLQCYPFGSTIREGWLGPIPGAYAIIAGRLPIPESTAEQLLTSAQRALSELQPARPHLANLLEHGDGQLARELRYLRTEVWPALYQVLTLQERDPIRVWSMAKPQAIATLSTGAPLRTTIQAFYDALWSHYANGQRVDSALDCIAKGVAFLKTAKAWHQNEFLGQSLRASPAPWPLSNRLANSRPKGEAVCC